jgi:hypothetical protein
MTKHEPADLDQRRDAAGLMGVEMRRHALEGFEADREARRTRDADLEAQMLAGPSETWPDAAARAIYLLRLLAPCAEAQDRRIARLLERAVIDLDWLSREDRGGPPDEERDGGTGRRAGAKDGSPGDAGRMDGSDGAGDMA